MLIIVFDTINALDDDEIKFDNNYCFRIDIAELALGKMLVIQTGIVSELLARYRVIMQILLIGS